VHGHFISSFSPPPPSPSLSHPLPVF
jgi:hypothetical protein